MSFKNVLLVSLLITPPLNQKITNTPIIITGTYYMSNINSEPFYTLNIASSYWGYLYVKYYEDNTLKYEQKVLDRELSNAIFKGSIQSKKNEKKRIKIVVDYYGNDDIEDTVIEFDYFSPSYANKIVENHTTYKSDHPISIDFKAKGNQCMITENYEYFTIDAPDTVTMDGRYLLFSDVSYTVKTTYPDVTNYAYFKIDYLFNGAGFALQNGMTMLKIQTDKKNNTYYLRDDYDYYVNHETGEISRYENMYTEEDTINFFLPISVGFNKEIKAEYQIKNVNLNHETYTLQTKVVLGDSKFDESFENIFRNGFYYYRYETPLEGVIYNA